MRALRACALVVAPLPAEERAEFNESYPATDVEQERLDALRLAREALPGLRERVTLKGTGPGVYLVRARKPGRPKLGRVAGGDRQWAATVGSQVIRDLPTLTIAAAVVEVLARGG